MKSNMLRDTIIKFHQEHLPMMLLEIVTRQDVNLYVSRTSEGYQLVASLSTLEKIGLNEKELEALLWHEKAHFELHHLEGSDSLPILYLLATLIGLFLVISLLMTLFFNVYTICAILGGIEIFVFYHILFALNIRRGKELDADSYALEYCDREVFKSLLCKLEKIYQTCKNISYFSTHPSIEKRLLNINKAPAGAL